MEIYWNGIHICRNVFDALRRLYTILEIYNAATNTPVEAILYTMGCVFLFAGCNNALDAIPMPIIDEPRMMAEEILIL